MTLLELTVPTNVSPGDRFRVQGMNGEIFLVECPPDAPPGSAIRVEVPATTLTNVTPPLANDHNTAYEACSPSGQWRPVVYTGQRADGAGNLPGVQRPRPDTRLRRAQLLTSAEVPRPDLASLQGAHAPRRAAHSQRPAAAIAPFPRDAHALALQPT